MNRIPENHSCTAFPMVDDSVGRNLLTREICFSIRMCEEREGQKHTFPQFWNAAATAGDQAAQIHTTEWRVKCTKNT